MLARWRRARKRRGGVLTRTIAASALLPTSARRWVLRRGGTDLADDARIEVGVRILRPARLSIGRGCFIGTGCYFENTAKVVIADDVWIAAHCRFMTASHQIGPAGHRAGKDILAPIAIESGTWIGAGATVLPGITIAEGCVIGAGAVVTRDTEPNGLYVGVPARRIRDLEP